ncbi:putative peptidase YqhT [Clostridia bacterium]|nr:putative peptidase YqhT [Clostridia bacterium]
MNNREKLQKFCDSSPFDALLLTGEPNRFYATGVATSDGLAILSADRAVFLTDSRYIETAQKNLPDFKVLQIARGTDYYKLTRELASDWKIATLGFEDGIRTVKSHEKWQKELPNVRWLPADTSKIRDVKELWEIDRMKKAQRIAERALDAVLGLIKPGLTEREIAAELIYHMLKFGAGRMSFDPIVASGPNSSMPHAVPGDRKIAVGDFITMDFGCVCEGYCSDMTRTVALGRATDEMRLVYSTVLNAQLAGITAAKAGVSGEAIHAAAADVIGGAGFGDYFGHGFGHGLGVEVHEGSGAYPGAKEPLQAGTVISAEPGIYLPGKFGVRIEDCIVIRENGVENLMNAPKDLLII